MSGARYPAPVRQPEDTPFWEAAAEGRFLVPRCDTCGKTHWYPRPVCPFCQGDTRWEEHDGRGVIYSFTLVAKAARGAFALGYLELTDGLRIYGAFADSTSGQLAIDAAARIAFANAEDGTAVPVFEIIDAASPQAPSGGTHEA